jgi:hypothetical protein
LWPHVGAQLLREEAEGSDDGFIAQWLTDTLRMADRLGCRHQLGVVRSRSHLLQVHDAVLHSYSTRRAALGERRETGELEVRESPHSPPPAGTAAIRPLTTPEALQEEGRTMRHCIASYDRRVRRQGVFVYRVLRPERATLSIRWDWARGGWTIDQLRGPGNRPVQSATERAVLHWLGGGSEP